AMPGLVGQIDLLCQDPAFSPAFRCGRIPVRTQRHALTMNVRTEGSFDAYWSERSKNLRATIRTRANRVTKAGLQPRLVCLTGTEQMRDAVGRFAALETSGWKGRAGTALGSDSIQGPFYADIMERFAETGQAFVYEYWLDDRLAASQLAIAAGSMLVLLKTTYNEEFAYYSPGRLLLREVIRDGFERFPGGAVEFYTNADSDQLAWATGQRWIEHVTLYRNPAVEQLMTGVQSLRRRLQAALRRPSPQAEQSA
ncbi:MAG: GNAT family N-acetyltransferase, partial [Actinomycetota bacterium]